MENRVVKIGSARVVLAATVLLTDLHNSCSESGAKTAHTIHSKWITSLCSFCALCLGKL